MTRLDRIVRRLWSCKEVISRMGHGRLETAGRAERLWLQFHIRWCLACRRYVRQLSAVTKAFHLDHQSRFNPARAEAFKKELTQHLLRQ